MGECAFGWCPATGLHSEEELHRACACACSSLLPPAHLQVPPTRSLTSRQQLHLKLLMENFAEISASHHMVADLRLQVHNPQPRQTRNPACLTPR